MSQETTDDEKARQRAEMILKVRSGQATATDVAKKMGISRKTYYKWEGRALKGMVDALAELEGGRPPAPVDAEKERLRQEVETLKLTVLRMEQQQRIREILDSDPAPDDREGRTEKKGGDT